MGRRCLVRLLVGKCCVAMVGAAAVVALVLFGWGAAARCMRCVCSRLCDGRHDAHGHGVAQQATQDQHEDEEDGQSATHAADLSEPPPALP